jgi:DNA-binding NarL/FixJ family response regulator
VEERRAGGALAWRYEIVVRRRTRSAPSDPLTPREAEVLKLIAEAFTTKQIAEALYISPKTVENHRNRIFQELGMHDRVELTRYAIRRGLVRL